MARTSRDGTTITAPAAGVSGAPLAPDAVDGARVAVLVPCFDEEHAVASVVDGFQRALPGATVYVYDNGSTDETVARATQAGAVIGFERRKGKGNVIRRMFADIDADVYVMVDGDGTYDPSAAPAMVERLWTERLDMVVGARDVAVDATGVVYRRGHATGNAAFSRSLKLVIGGEFTDIFSGYRVMSRRFVKSLPVYSSGFEIETELSAHAIEVDAACAEVSTRYTSRLDGSESKLSTYRDGARIAWTIVRLFEAIRPLPCFTLLFALLTALAVGLAVPVVDEFARTGLVLRFPTAILAASIQIVALLSLACGIILRSVQRARQEARRLAYLAMPAPRAIDPATADRRRADPRA
jgi:hypothetical protein